MNFTDELTINNELWTFFQSEFYSLESSVQNFNGNSSVWNKDTPSLFNNPNHTTKHNSILNDAYYFYLHWNIARNAQNASYTASIIYFLDVLKDFNAITLADGFSALDLFLLEEEFQQSVLVFSEPKPKMFLTLSLYYDYYKNLDYILNMSMDDAWDFLNEKEQNELLLKIENFFVLPNTELFSFVNSKSPLLIRPVVIDGAKIDLLLDDSVLVFTNSSSLDFKAPLWFNAIYYALCHNQLYEKKINKIVVYFSYFDYVLFLSVDQLIEIDKIDRFIERVKSIRAEAKKYL